MMKNLYIFILVLFIPLGMNAQYDVDNQMSEEDEEVESRYIFDVIKKDLYIGGDLNLSIGGQSFLYLAPFVGYEFMPDLSAGISFMGKVLKNPSASRSSFGSGLFVRYTPEVPVIVETSFNFYNTRYTGITKDPVNSKSWMVGLGYAQSMGNGRSYTQIMFQYDLLKNPDVPENLLLSFSDNRIYFKFGIVYYLND